MNYAGKTVRGTRIGTVRLALGFAAALAVSLACSAGTEPPGPAQSVKVGESVTFIDSKSNRDDDKAKVEVVVTKVDVHARSSREHEKARRGQFVVADVEVTAVSRECDVWPRSFRFIASDGQVWTHEYGPEGFGPVLDDIRIQQGQKNVGKVVFDADPALIEGGRIELSNWNGTPVAYWSW